MKLPRSSPHSVNSASHAAQGVALAARDVLDMPGVDQQHLYRALGLAQR
ncbi:hypothetical protein [Pseudonocardia aurantiaca]|uniref:Uncharacterized protein n=1 Tax=Pseudonocardia aurantiaca TaxID=75290 RepID=A0ABW4FXY5_9PSEU